MIGRATGSGQVVAASVLLLQLVPATSSAQEVDEAALAERGAYVARAADCTSCHTEPDGQPFAGGVSFPTPFGRLYSPNITPDRATGVGTWTLEDFEGALRRGVRKDGSYLYPAMPYDAYTKMTDDDVEALFEYFKTVEPVENKVPVNELTFPFDLRAGIAVWQTLYLNEGRFEPDPEQGEVWNRGAYLVNALGHCGSCHTPRNAALATEEDLALTGYRIEEWYAPDISGEEESVIRDWAVDDLVNYLKTGTNEDKNVTTIGPMQEVVHESLSHLEDGDLVAMATYLKDQPPLEEEPEEPETWSTSPERMAAGENVYRIHCLTCHGVSGRGEPGAAPSLVDNGAVTADKPYNILSAVLLGLSGEGDYGAMPSFASVLSDREISDVTNYIRLNWGNGAEPNATPWLVTAWRNSTDVDEANANRALVCPPVGDDVMNEATREALVAARDADGAPDKVRAAVEQYREFRPESSTSAVVNRLSAAYCGLLPAAGLSYREQGVELVEFMGRVAEAALGK